jgi:hypothetical protein
MRHLVTLVLLLLAAIHLLPLAGAAGPARLAMLYGVEVAGPDLEILMRHRAVLFGLLGALFAVAAFMPPLQPVALAIGFASVASFVALALSVGGYGPALARVVRVDIVALGLVLAGAVALVLSRRAG